MGAGVGADLLRRPAPPRTRRRLPRRARPVRTGARDRLRRPGYGTDGGLWGGEFLLADLTDFRRIGRLRSAPLPGGDAAVREPWRVAVSWLQRALGEESAAEYGRRLDPRCEAVRRIAAS